MPGELATPSTAVWLRPTKSLLPTVTDGYSPTPNAPGSLATPCSTSRPQPMKSAPLAADDRHSPQPATHGSPVLAAVGSLLLASNDGGGFVPAGGDSPVAATSGAAKLVSDPTIPATADPIPISDSTGGYVTAETALLLPVLLGIGYALALVVLLAADQIRCGDAAWEAARALARGVPAAQLSDIAARYAPAGAHASVWSKDGSLTVEVDRDQSVASRFLPSMRISATATVPCEPRVDGCPIDSSDVSGRPNG